MTQADLDLLVRLGLVELVAKTGDGKVAEYRLTGNGRILAK